MTADIWTIAEAKAKFSEVIDLAISSGLRDHYPERPYNSCHRLGGGMVAPAQAHWHTR